MIDKEKIEKGLRCCIDGDHCNSTECPYYDAAPNIQGCTQALCQDALALLKEQEAEKKCCWDCEYYGACHDK